MFQVFFEESWIFGSTNSKNLDYKFSLLVVLKQNE